MIKTLSQTSLRNQQPILTLSKQLQSYTFAQPHRQSLNLSSKSNNSSQPLRVSNSMQRKDGLQTPLKGKMNIFSAVKLIHSNNNSDAKIKHSFNVYNNASINNYTPNDQYVYESEQNKMSLLEIPQLSSKQRSEHDIQRENQILQQSVIKYRSEAEHFKLLYSQTQRSSESFLDQSMNLSNFKSRIEKLEEVIEHQAKEIDLWKLKNERTLITEDRNQDDQYQKELILQLEQQIEIVIQQNESLNESNITLQHEIKHERASFDEKVQLLLNENVRLQDLTSKQSSSRDGGLQKFKEQEKIIKIQKEEIKTWHETFKQYEKEQEKSIEKEKEFFKSRVKIQELEYRLTKNQDDGELKTLNEELKIKLQCLITENCKLNDLLVSIRPTNTDVTTIIEELNSQSMFYQEELKRFRRQQETQKQLESQLNHFKLQIVNLQEEIHRSNQSRFMNQNDEKILYSEFERSQELVTKLLSGMQH